METIARKDFIAAIDAGIVAADIPLKPAEKLAAVGREAKRIGVGTYGPHPCKCPLSRAGLTDHNGQALPYSGISSQRADNFAWKFDQRMSLLVRGDYCPGEIFYVGIEG